MYYEGKYKQQREKKERRIRRVIIIFMILIPSVIFVAFGKKILDLETELVRVNASLDELQHTLAEYEAKISLSIEQIKEVVVVTPQPTEEANPNAQETLEPSKAPVATVPKASRQVYLTFDDGPSVYTTEILDILDEYNVKATFFVLGKEDTTSIELLKEINERGHTIGMHSYSHKYDEIYASKDAFIQDYQKLYTFLKGEVGVESFCYRFPGGSSNTISDTDMLELVDYLDEQGVAYHDWNISSGDGTGAVPEPEQIEENVLKDIENYSRAVVLLHDASGKQNTVEALPGIIEKILSMEDTEILPITEDTVPVQHIQRVNEQRMEDIEQDEENNA